MIEPFYLSDKIGCVYGRQRPRVNSPATIKREVATVFGRLGNPGDIIVSRGNSLVDGNEENNSNNFFSDVNSAVRKDLLTGKVPFRKVDYAEDQALAQDMQNNGYLKAYTAQGIVWHSNDYTAKEYFHRKFDEFLGLHKSTKANIHTSLRSLVLGWIRPTIRDWSFIYRDGEYSYKSKLLWFARSPLYNLGNKAGQYFASKHINNPNKYGRLSLEKRKKS